MMNFRLARPSTLVDVSRLDQLRYVRSDESGCLHVGALARHRDLEHLTGPGAPDGFSVIHRRHNIGHYAIRAAGTFGGSLAHADPASEWCMIARLLDGEITVSVRRASALWQRGISSRVSSRPICVPTR